MRLVEVTVGEDEYFTGAYSAGNGLADGSSTDEYNHLRALLRHGVYLTLCIFCVISSGYTYTLHKANKYLIVHGGIRDKMGTPVNGIGVLLSTNGIVLATENICLAVAFWS